MRLFPVCSTLALASALCAQSVVSPGHFTNAEGNTWDSVMMAVGTSTVPFIYQEICGDLQFTPRTINSIAFRRDGNANSTQTIAAFSILCDVICSTAANGPTAPSNMFANNHGMDRAQVAAAKLVQFPATSPGTHGRPFEYRIPFTTPFAFGGAGPLCWEVRINSTTNPGAFNLDFASSSSTNPGTQNDTIGTGCIATGSAHTSPMSLTGSSSPSWPQQTLRLTYNGSRFPKNALVTFGIGTSTSSFGGVPLPFELPGTLASPSKACTVYNNWLVTIPQLSNATGGVTATLGVLALPQFNGGNLYTQAIGLDPAANNWGIVFSNTVLHHIVAPWTTVPVGDVQANNLSGTGTARASYGVVAEFQ